MKVRAQQLVPIDMVNQGLSEGYLTRVRAPNGVYIGGGLVTNNEGTCDTYAYNTTEDELELEIEQQEIIPFDYWEFPRVNFDVSEIEEEGGHVDRISKVINSLHVAQLNTQEKDLVLDWAKYFSDIFHVYGEILGATHKVQHRIPTTDDIVIVKKQYHQPPEQLKSEIIAPRRSPYSSPVLIVLKKLDASRKRKYRLVIEYRRLNEKVIGDAYPLPNITDILERSGKAHYFSVFDLVSDYHQVETHPDDRSKTASSTTRGHFEYQRMSMGIKKAPETFQRLMDTFLPGMLRTEAYVYLDDIVIYSESLEEHGIKTRRLFKRQREANLKLQPDKRDLLCPEVAYLGHIIGRKGVRPNPAQVAAIKEFPRHKTVRNVPQFLGLSGYYRRFIENYAKFAKPLVHLLKKEAKFFFGLEQEESFRKLREALCQEPILKYRLKDYQFVFAYKKRKLNRAVEALSGNPIVKINCDPSEIDNGPAHSAISSEKLHKNKGDKLIMTSHPTQTVHRTLPFEMKLTETSEQKKINPVDQARSTTGRVTRSQTAPLSKPSTSSGFRTSSSIQKWPATQATGIATR